MSLDDPTMGATFPSWTSDAERDSADKMPAWGVPGETPEQHADQIALRFYHRDTGADLGFAHVGYIPSNAAWAFLHGGVWQRIDTSGAWRLWRAGVQSLNGAPISSETPEEGEWPARAETDELGKRFTYWRQLASQPLSLAECQKVHAAITRCETPEEGEWPARDRVPMVRMDTMMVSAEPQTVEWSAPSDPSSWDEIRGACLDCGAPIPVMDHKCSKCAGSVPNIGLFAMGLRPADVTPEMIAAGQMILPHLVEEDIVEIFRAMHAVAPVPLVSDAEKDRDDWKREAMRVYDKLIDVTGQLRDARAERGWGGRYTIAEVGELLASRDARIAELDSRLAAFTAANVPEPEAPDPIANAIRPREVDPRRMGLA